MKGGRCPNGTRKNKKTGNCEKKGSTTTTTTTTISSTKVSNNSTRCPKGTRRNKYGRCVKNMDLDASSNAKLDNNDINYIIDNLNLQPSAKEFIKGVHLNRKYKNKYHKYDRKMDDHDNLHLQAEAEVKRILSTGTEAQKRELTGILHYDHI